MAIPSKQIGWGPQENLLWEISKQLEKMGCYVGNLTSPILPRLYGSFYDTTEQTATANVATPMKLNSVDFANGVSVSNDGAGNSTLISVSRTGVYNIQFSAQFVRQQGGSAKNANIYIRKNGTAVPWSATYVSFESNAVYIVAAWNWLIELTPSDTLELMWVQNDDIHMVNAPANATHPEVPSLIVTVTQVN